MKKYPKWHIGSERLETCEPGRKADAEKTRWDLVPWQAMCAVADVLTFGAAKYGAENWRKVPEARRRYIAAAMRHLIAYAMGEESDPESGKSHLAHATCCLLFLMEV